MLDELFKQITDWIPDMISTVLEQILEATIYRLFYYLAIGLCAIVDVLDQMFQVFAGLTKVSYNGESNFLINIFFSNHAVSNVYWGMALIGIALSFAFALAAVIRKMFDLGGRIQQSLGQTLTALFRSILLILSLTAIMMIVLNSTAVLMQQVNYVFANAEVLDLPETMVYTDEQFATMGRVLNTIGNYSLNPSFSSRYNINTCYNEIRADLYELQRQKVFRYYYPDTGAEGHSWQAVLQKIANAADLRRDLKMDVSYESVTSSILNAMTVMKTDASFRPLKEFTRVAPSETLVPLDRMIFLMSSMHAAKNDEYNENASLTDPVRGPYYAGEKSIYDLDSVNSDFSISPAKMDYIILYVSAVAVIFDLVIIILNCIARIFNMLFLYVIAPPIFASAPLDNGARTRQWTTAFTVQSLSVFGTVIAMRLLLIYLPIVASPKLVLFDNMIMNLMAKLLLIYGGFETAKKATGLLTGILTENAGAQALYAGDMSRQAGGLVRGAAALGLGATKTGAKVGIGAAKVGGKVGYGVAKAGGKALGFAASPLTNLGKRAYRATLKKPVDAVMRFGGRVADGVKSFGNWWGNLGSGGGGEGARKTPPPLPDRLRRTGDSGGSGGGGSGNAPVPRRIQDDSGFRPNAPRMEALPNAFGAPQGGNGGRGSRDDSALPVRRPQLDTFSGAAQRPNRAPPQQQGGNDGLGSRNDNPIPVGRPPQQQGGNGGRGSKDDSERPVRRPQLEPLPNAAPQSRSRSTSISYAQRPNKAPPGKKIED